MGNCCKKIDLIQIHKYEELGAAALSASEYGQALTAYHRALDYRIKRLALNIKECGRLYLLIAFTYSCQEEKTDKALSYFQRSLDYLRVPGDYRYYSAAFFFLSVLYLRMHQYQKAQKFMEDAYKLRMEHLGENHLETITCLTGFAKIARVQEDFDKALDWYAKARKKLEGLSGEKEKAIEAVDAGKDPLAKKLNGILVALYPEIPQIEYLCAEIHLIKDEVDKTSSCFKNIFVFIEKEKATDTEKYKSVFDEYSQLVSDLYDDFPELKKDLYDYTNPKVEEKEKAKDGEGQSLLAKGGEGEKPQNTAARVSILKKCAKKKR